MKRLPWPSSMHAAYKTSNLGNGGARITLESTEKTIGVVRMLFFKLSIYITREGAYRKSSSGGVMEILVLGKGRF